MKYEKQILESESVPDAVDVVKMIIERVAESYLYGDLLRDLAPGDWESAAHILRAYAQKVREQKDVTSADG